MPDTSFVRYEDKHYTYVWKPHGIPTTWGIHRCFLDELCDAHPSFFAGHIQLFSAGDEYGLINRLDNDTAGLLTFAKSPDIYNEYQRKEQQKQMRKIYVADTVGRIDREKTVTKHPGICTFEHISGYDAFAIHSPLMHHKFDESRMVVLPIDDEQQRKKAQDTGRGEIHHATTYVIPFFYDEVLARTTSYILIQQGKRHQIRVHMASMGYPVVGDALYHQKHAGNTDVYLHLRCMGMGEGDQIDALIL